MLKGIFVIHNSGICLYNKYNSDIFPNEQLFSGFLTALSRFCVNIIGEKISRFCTNTLKFNFIYEHELFFVFIVHKNDILEDFKPQFRQIMKEFYKEFTNQRTVFEKHGLIPQLTNFETSLSSICS